MAAVAGGSCDHLLPTTCYRLLATDYLLPTTCGEGGGQGENSCEMRARVVARVRAALTAQVAIGLRVHQVIFLAILGVEAVEEVGVQRVPLLPHGACQRREYGVEQERSTRQGSRRRHTFCATTSFETGPS